MALLNIGAGNKDDAFYRYKMPKMITKIEGRGNGIKTNVVNMVDIAKALGRPASYTTKYFGCELGAQSKFDEKTGTSHVNGAHDTSKLAGLLENFIKKFVQCYGSKDKKAMRRAEKERLKEGEAADEEQKKLKKEAVKKKGSTGNSKSSSKKKSHHSDEDHSPVGSQADEHEAAAVADDSDDDVQWQTDTSMVAAQQKIQEQLNAVTASMVMLSANEEKPKSGKSSPSREVKPKVNGHTNGFKADKPEDQPEELVDAIKEYVKKGSPVGQLKTFLDSLPGMRQEIIDALFQALFEGVGKGFSNEVEKKKNYIAAVVEEEGSQQLLLHAVETFCGKARAEAVKEVALVLNTLYQNDLLEEELIVEWYEKGLNGGNKGSPIWKYVKPFVEWLQNAEPEEEEE
ncbi:UNVERIFIED_CONTAM: putative eukaryotic translation initiation factor 5-2 [Sesamum radiatum]|uniref:Eukaryotic translation initiation factor 5-2 n=1 Tax=Sesamum radiatum TaxID=300843 RepID=A0AAW2SHU8_SESRA